MKLLRKSFPYLCILIGFVIFLYPSFSNFIQEHGHKTEISQYQEITSELSPQTIKTSLQAAQNYNKQLEENPALFYYPDELDGYESALDPGGDGILGYISIPKINVNLPIYHGTDANVLQIGAGHVKGSSFPLGGTSEHAVIAAHRGLPSAELFSRLDELEEDDCFTVHVLNRELTYKIDQIFVVLPTDQSKELIEDGKTYCTLLTCTPYGVNDHRLLVRGELTSTKLDAAIDEKMPEVGITDPVSPLKRVKLFVSRLLDSIINFLKQIIRK